MKRNICTALLFATIISFSVNAADLRAFQNEKGKWGYIDSDSNVVISPTYETVEEFIDGKAKVSKKQKFGIIDTLGNVLVPINYANIGPYNKYGLAQINSGGKVEEGVVSGGKLGYINTKGEVVLPAKYDEIGFFDNTSTAWVRAGKKYGLINSQGALISEVKYAGHGAFDSNGVCWVNVGGVEQQDKKIVGGLWGYIKSNGEELVAPKYLSVKADFVGGISWVQNSKRKFAYINDNGEFLNETYYDDFAGVFENGMSWVKLGDKYGYINAQGEAVTEIKYDGAYQFSGGMAAVGLKESKKAPVLWGYINEAGNEVFSPRFESVIIKPNKGRAFVQQNKKWAYVDDKGNILSNFEFTVVSEISDDGRALVSTKELSANTPIVYNYVLDSDGKKINAIPYENISQYSDDFAVVKKNSGTYCWINTEGKECFDSGYTKVGDFKEGLAYAYKEGKGYYIDKTGIARISFDAALPMFGFPFEGDYAMVKTDSNVWGCIDKSGIFVVPLGLSTEADAKYLLENVYKKSKKPLGARYVLLMNMYKNVTKCSIGDVLPNESWAY